MSLPAKLWPPIRRNAIPVDLTSSNGNELWSCTRPIVQRINPGDSMVLWHDRESGDPSFGPQWPVKQVYWDASGRMHLEMVLMILDPDDEVRAAYTSKIRSGFSDLFERTRLWTEDEGSDISSDLYRSGWRQ